MTPVRSTPTLAFLFAASRTVAPTPPSGEAGVNAVREMVGSYDAAWLAKDTATVARLLAPGYVYFTSTGGLSSRAETVAFLSDTSYVLDEMDRSEVEITVAGTMAGSAAAGGALDASATYGRPVSRSIRMLCGFKSWVDDAPGVRVVHGAGHVVQDARRRARGKRALREDALVERLAAEVRHRVIDERAGPVDRVDRHDVVVLEPRGDARLPEEALTAGGPASQSRAAGS